MKKNNSRIFLLESFLILFLILILFSTRLFFSKIAISAFLLFYAVLVRKTIKSVNTISFREKEVRKYMFIFSIFYIVIYYIIGFYVGYYRAVYKFSFYTLLHYIIPIILIIYSSELLRREFLSIKSKFSIIITFIYGILIDLIIYTNTYNLGNINGFLEAIGYVFLASIASNLLYNYLSKNFGIWPNVIYRIITTVYLYIIPITPDVHMYFKTFARIVYPIVILLVLTNTYEGKSKALMIKNAKMRNIVSAVTIVFICMFTMLISCNFRYGLIVIGSNSMMNELNKGDAVIFDTNIKELKKGQIVLYKKNDITIVHRIIDIEEINGNKMYYTKGDNNKEADTGYRTYEDIKGIVELKIRNVGILTVWINELFS